MKVFTRNISRGYQPYTNYDKKRTETTVADTSYCTAKPNFCGGIKSKIIDATVKLMLSRLKQYSPDEYKKLSEFEKHLLRKAYKRYNNTEDCKYIESLHDDISERLKQYFDKHFGENNYVVIIIGRSASSVGKVLGYKIGEENVKNIPMSNAGKYLSDSYVNQIKEQKHLDNFIKYLDGIGLNKDTISSSKKNYIIIDYCNTRESLNGAKKLLMRDDVLGKKNIISQNILDCIESYELWKEAHDCFFSNSFKTYSFVDKSQRITDLQKKHFDTTKIRLPIRLMWFKLLDNQMLKNKTKVEGDLLPRCYKSVKNLFQKNIEEK